MNNSSNEKATIARRIEMKLIKKLRADSNWAVLTEEQRVQLMHWMLKENVSFKEALERAREEFGVRGSMSGIMRFFKHESQNRCLTELVLKNNDKSGSTEAERKLMETMTANLAQSKPKAIAELGGQVKLLMEKDDRDIRQKKLEIGAQRRALDEVRRIEAERRRADKRQ